MNNIHNRIYESALHEELEMTDTEIRAELRAEGLDPNSEVEALRSMINVMVDLKRASLAQHRNLGERRRFFLFDEAVSAGTPSPSPNCQATESNILDILKASNNDTVLWARVSGLSMRDEGIMDKDFILVDTKREARDGDIVLAHLAGQGQVVKRLRLPKEGGAELESANPDFPLIQVNDPSTLMIHGVVIGKAGRV